ncbi:MAG TPA: FlgD immunoglobulin-like domain containing protein [Candidatus Eisenbacteria bacterium]
MRVGRNRLLHVRSGFALLPFLILLLLPYPALAAPLEHPVILLHIAAPTGKNPCGSGLVGGDGVVTAAPLDSPGPNSYFVYVLAGNAGREGPRSLAGVQFGIEYDGGMGTGIVVDDWRRCTTLEFTSTTIPPLWPAAGSGNLLTWDPLNNCQTAELAVVGYFSVSVYSPATMRIVPRPTDGMAAVAECDPPILTDVYPRRLGLVSFGGASHEGDVDGFNPSREPPAATDPVITFTGRGNWENVADDDVRFEWSVSDDVPHLEGVRQSWRVDNGAWVDVLEGRDFRAPRAENLEEGVHTLQVRATDAENQKTLASATFATTVPRNLPPSPRILTSLPANPTGLALLWTAEDDRTPADLMEYEFDFRQLDLGYLESHADDWRRDTEIVIERLPIGSYQFQLRARDMDGDESTEPEVIRFEVTEGPTGEPPRVSLEGPGFDEEVTDPDVTWRVWGFDDTMERTDLQYSWRFDSGAWSPWDTTTVRSFPITSTGRHRVSVRARDLDGLVTWTPDYREFLFVGTPLALARPAPSVSLAGIHPNPSRGPTQFVFDVMRPGTVTMDVLDVKGRLVQRLLDGYRDAGSLQLAWDGRDREGRLVAAGVYLVRLHSESDESTGRITIIR